MADAALAPQRVAELAEQMGVVLAPAASAALVAHAQLLRRWNRVHNLTAIASDQEYLTHHLLDCLAIIHPLDAALRAQGPRVNFLDAGSGGGLPGIVLAIARPQWQATLVDAVQKKCAFLQQAAVELGLRNTRVLHARLETLAEPHQDLIVSRAFASLRDFVACTRNCLHPQGIWAAMKGRVPAGEIAELPRDVQLLDTITLRVPLLAEERHLVILGRRPAND